MLDFICMGSTELLGTGRKRKIQNENMSPARFEPTPRHLTADDSAPQTARHDALMVIRGLMSHKIVGYKLIKPLRDRVTTRVK